MPAYERLYSDSPGKYRLSRPGDNRPGDKVTAFLGHEGGSME